MRVAAVHRPLPEPATLPAEGEAPLAKEQAFPKRAAWWLWPHLLSLDAPLVAIGWQRWWARLTGTNLPWFHEVILGLCVWMIYLADRWSDARRAEPDDLETRRHVFSHRRNAWTGVLLGAVIVSLAGLSLRYLDKRQFVDGLVLLAAVWVYFCSIHAGMRRPRWPVPKEAAVGTLFAIGTGFFVCCPVIRFDLALGLAGAMFGALCFLNCALITKWEHSPQDRRDPASLLNAFPRVTAGLARGCAGLALLASVGALALRPGIAFAPVIVGAAGLWTLDRFQDSLSKESLRVLADVVLLAPWVGLWVG